MNSADRRPTAIVTGATRGIGRATAIALARRGYDVAITGRTQHEGDAAKRPEAAVLTELQRVPGSLDSTAAAIEEAGGRAVALVLDLLDRDALQPVAEAAIEGLGGRVDVLLNNAIYVGPAGEALFLDTPVDELERRIFGNVTAQMMFTQPILRTMVEHRSGVVASMTSGAGYSRPFARMGEGGWALSYGVSKAGLTRFAQQLVVEYPEAELTYLNLNPGAVATERVLAAGEKLAFVARVAAPVETIGEAVARILDSPRGTFANGATLEVQDLAVEWGLLERNQGFKP